MVDKIRSLQDADDAGSGDVSGDCGPSTDAGPGKVRIAETFTSRQGEGTLTGVDSFFIRTSGCNLRCWYCDTPYASWHPEGDRIPIGRLLDAAQASGARHVVVTGGEPLLASEIEVLCREIQSAGFHLTIETAGTLDRQIRPDLLSISPKLAASAPDADKHARWNRLHHQRRSPIGVMRALIDRAAQTQVKFVVSDVSEFQEIEDLVNRLGVKSNQVFIMPEGTSVEAMDDAKHELFSPVVERGWQYCDRMQIRWYGNRRGT
jgi:7-carboxy-7-deazaguanine synthase